MKKIKLNKHLRIIWAIEKGLFICWLIIAIVLYPYSRMGYFSSLAHRNHKVSLFQHRLDMDLLFLLELVLMAMFFGLKSFVAKQKKDDYQEIICRMKKSKKPDTDEIQMLETLERSCEKKERGLRIAFLCVMVGIVFHLVFIVSFFGI
jgi:hypothetical protein